MQPHTVGPWADGSVLLRKGTPEPPALQDNPGWTMTLIRNPISYLFMELLHGVTKGGVTLGNGAVPQRLSNGLSLGSHV